MFNCLLLFNEKSKKVHFSKLCHLHFPMTHFRSFNICLMFQVLCCWTILLWFCSQICLHVSNSVRKEKEWNHSIKNTQRTIIFQNVFVFEFILKKCKFLFVNLFCILRKINKKIWLCEIRTKVKEWNNSSEICYLCFKMRKSNVPPKVIRPNRIKIYEKKY